jgi:hypothetical protein
VLLLRVQVPEASQTKPNKDRQSIEEFSVEYARARELGYEPSNR